MKFSFFKTKEDSKIFWGRGFFDKNLDFDYGDSKHYLLEKNLNEEQKCKLIEEFIELYQKNSINLNNMTTFLKSLDLMNEVYDLSPRTLYNYTVCQIEEFTKKEDFEIFYYFKSFNFLYKGYNNIFFELMSWFVDNEEEINNLLGKQKSEEEEIIFFNSSMIIGTTGKGKSNYLKKLLLQNKTIVIKNKKLALKSFKEEDKDYFYNLFINLTKEKNLNNFLLQINKNKNRINFKGVLVYIEKRLNCEILRNKLKDCNEKDSQCKQKFLKI